MSTPCGASCLLTAARTGEAEVRVGIIGCGLVGQKRAGARGGARVVACADAAAERAEVLARSTASRPEVLPHWRAVVERPDVDLVIVAPPHHLLPAETPRAAVRAGKHVRVKNPAARNPAEREPVLEAATRNGMLVR